MLTFLWDWFTSALNYFGLWRRTYKVSLLGLDNAGKTTLLYIMNDSLHSGRNSGAVTVNGTTFTTLDLGGLVYSKEKQRLMIASSDGIVFMIDAADRDRFEEAKAELDSLAADEQVASAPILILGNKIDRPGAASEEELRTVFGLHGQTTGKGTVPLKELQRRPMEVFMCSVLKRLGYGEGFRWLSQYMS